jgi:thiol-disulfide isomerase/thioredoxin
VVRNVVLTLCLVGLGWHTQASTQELDPDSVTHQRYIFPHHAEMVSDVTFAGADEKEITLSSYRDKPLLIDLWATWCAPCLVALPSLNRIFAEVKEKGLAVISFDQDKGAASATAYLARHHYRWTNFHDGDRSVEKALQGDSIPLTVLIDAKGMIVYFDFGGDDAGLRKAIAGLGPEFASVAPSAETADPSHQN